MAESKSAKGRALREDYKTARMQALKSLAENSLQEWERKNYATAAVELAEFIVGT